MTRRYGMTRLAIETLRDSDAPFEYIGVDRAASMSDAEVDALLFDRWGCRKLTDVFTPEAAEMLSARRA